MLAAASTAQAPPGSGAADPFAACQLSEEEICTYVLCVANVGFGAGLAEEAAKRLEAYLESQQPEACLYHNLARLVYYSDRNRAIKLFQSAADSYVAAEQLSLAYPSLSGQIELLQQVGRRQDAENLLARAHKVAEASGDMQVQVHFRIDSARMRMRQGRNLVGALRQLHEVKGEIFKEGSGCPSSARPVCVSWLVTTGALYLELNRYAEARSTYETLERLAVQSGDSSRRITARYNLALLRMREWKTTASPDVREQIISDFREILQVGRRSARLSTVALAQYELGKLLEGEEGYGLLQSCVEEGRTLPHPRRLSLCLHAMAAKRATQDPAQARKWLDEGRSLLLDREDLWGLAHAGNDMMEVVWTTQPGKEAQEKSFAYLDDIEALRELQSDETGRADLFAEWVGPYYELSGRILESSSASGGDEELGQALLIVERLRARVLLDALEASGSLSLLEPPEEVLDKRRQVLRDVLHAQKRLLDPTLTPSQKMEALGQVEAAEEAESDLERWVAKEHPDYAALRTPTFASLTEITSNLEEDEALLSFQLAPWRDLYGGFAGGSWLLVVTRGGSKVYRLPDRDNLEQDIHIVRNLFGQEEILLNPVVRLYDELLGPALSELSENIDKLVILPDGALHLFPLGALRAREDAEPLIERFELSAAPSATLWLRWRKSRPEGAEIPALALADPDLPGADGSQESVLRSWLRENGIEVHPLKHARQEGQAVVRHLGGSSRLQVGKEATEWFLKQTNLSQFAVLHFAAHALVDDLRSKDSAILLAPGSPGEDGLLQSQDIVGLDLEGRLVVLSACESATGTLLRGEGVLSLARSFFQAGAHTVVGSLWPLRDDETAELFDAFYRHLAQGLSVAQALREAQLEAHQAGDPVTAWAGVLVLGDGGFVPFPGGLGRPPVDRRALGAALLAGTLLAFGIVLLFHRRHRRPLSQT